MLSGAASPTYAQTGDLPAATGITEIGSGTIDALQSKYGQLTRLLQKQSDKLLERMQRKEAKLCARMRTKDSTAAQALFAGSQQYYRQL